jgi:DNA-binding transcriptional LysR family regulator
VCRRLRFEPDIRFSSDDLLVHHRIVQSGHAVAVLPDLLHTASPDRIRLVNVPGEPAARRILTACRRDADHPSRVRECRKTLRAQLP